MRKKYTRHKKQQKQKKQKKQKKRPYTKEKRRDKRKEKRKKKQTRKRKKKQTRKQKRKLKSGQVTDQVTDQVKGRNPFRKRNWAQGREEFVEHLRKIPKTYQKLNKKQIEKDTISLPFTTNKEFKPINLFSVGAYPNTEGGIYIPYYNDIIFNVPQKISSGAYGTVYRYSDESKGYSIAVKEFNTNEGAEAEAAIIRRLSKHLMRADLMGMKLGELKEWARSLGADDVSVDRLDDPKVAAIELILRTAPRSVMDDCNMINARVVIYNREEQKLIDFKLYDSIKDTKQQIQIIKKEANQLLEEQDELLLKLKKENPRSEKSIAEYEELVGRVGEAVSLYHKVLKATEPGIKTFYNNHDIYVLMDPMDNSLRNIFTELYKHFQELPKSSRGIQMYDLCFDILKMIAKNIKCLSDKGYYYCDLKTANILYKIFDNKLKIYFGDLGSIFEVDKEKKRKNSAKTYFYKYSTWTYPSPEYFGAQEDGDETDINACLVWSIGATFIDLLLKMMQWYFFFLDSDLDDLDDLDKLWRNLWHNLVEERIKQINKYNEKVSDPVTAYYEDINQLLNNIEPLFDTIIGIQQGKKKYNLWELLIRFFQRPEERITLDEICNLEFKNMKQI